MKTQRVTAHIEISPGELIDRHTILVIKSRRIADTAKLATVRTELDRLSELTGRLPWDGQLEQLAGDLLAINSDLWQIEDDLRDCERERRFGEHFVELARSVYHRNDARAATKQKIDLHLDSHLTEVKSYASLGAAGAP
ncbi:MAG TPA: hypothetical protein VF469_31350 [Kofleriaceae bacterium]